MLFRSQPGQCSTAAEAGLAHCKQIWSVPFSPTPQPPPKRKKSGVRTLPPPGLPPRPRRARRPSPVGRGQVGREPGEREAPGRPPARTPSPTLPARSPRSPLSCSSACKQMGIFFFQPGMVSAPCARSRARSSSPARSLSPGAGRASPRLPTRPPGPAAALSGLFSWAGAPRRLPGALRRRRAPRARLKLAGGSGWLRPGRAEGAAAAAAAVWPGGLAGPGAGGAYRPRAGAAEPPGGGRGRREWARAAASVPSSSFFSFFPFLVSPPPAGGTRSRRRRRRRRTKLRRRQD